MVTLEALRGQGTEICSKTGNQKFEIMRRAPAASEQKRKAHPRHRAIQKTGHEFLLSFNSNQCKRTPATKAFSLGHSDLRPTLPKKRALGREEVDVPNGICLEKKPLFTERKTHEKDIKIAFKRLRQLCHCVKGRARGIQ
jgi:hypothetical protein